MGGGTRVGRDGSLLCKILHKGVLITSGDLSLLSFFLLIQQVYCDSCGFDVLKKKEKERR